MAKHMDRLSSVDAAFLSQEREGSHMHIGSILLFEGPAPRAEEVTAHVESRLHLVPRYRHKLSFPRLEMGRPLWVDDPSFNIGYHVRQTALPAPGLGGAAAAAGRPDLQPAPGPLQAAVGAVAGRGARGRPLRGHQQDPPQPGGRRLRRRPDRGHVRPGPRRHGGPRPGRALAARARAGRGGPGRPRRDRPGLRPHGPRAPGGVGAGEPGPHGRPRRARPPPAWARWPGTPWSARPTRRSTARWARTGG